MLTGTTIAVRDSRRSIYSLNDRGDALAYPDAHGCETVAAAALFHFMDQGRQHARAAAAERMAESDGATVDVELVHVDAELASTGEHLRGKRFIQFDQVDLFDAQAGALERAPSTTRIVNASRSQGSGHGVR